MVFEMTKDHGCSTGNKHCTRGAQTEGEGNKKTLVFREQSPSSWLILSCHDHTHHLVAINKMETYRAETISTYMNLFNKNTTTYIHMYRERERERERERGKEREREGAREREREWASQRRKKKEQTVNI